MRTSLSKSLFTLAVFSATPALADVNVINFEGIAPYPNNNIVFIDQYYNGGTSSAGTSGPNYGVSFSANSLLLCLNSQTVTCSNGSRGGLAPSSAEGALFFVSGTDSVMNVAAGFEQGFSFNYVSTFEAGSVSVFDGLNGTGNLLATIALSPNAGSCPGYSAGYCPFSSVGVNFAGVARSVSFAGVANYIAFDDITFGSAIVGGGGAVPEPASWAMMVAGFGLAGHALRRRRRTALRFG
jgi:hypothetical protein